MSRIAESDAYRTKREELRKAELALMEQRERVAALRRSLPLDTVVDDYIFEGPEGAVTLSGMFTSPDRTLIVYQFMYGKTQTDPCPMCSMWIDGYNAVAPHVSQRVDFAVVAAEPYEELQRYATDRGWHNLRMFSAGDSSFKRDLGSEEEDGEQIEMVSVFRHAGDGNVVHAYSAGAELADGVRERGIDLLTPVWNLFDLTPEGRGDWYPSLTY